MKNPGCQVLKKVLVVHMEVSGSEVDTRAVWELKNEGIGGG